MDAGAARRSKIGYPVLVRPSFVLGGRAMEICYDEAQLERFVAEAFIAAEGQPVLIDRFLEDATEVDVDCLCDGKDVIIGGIMEHIEEAGVHSGDSACAIPPYSLSGPVVAEIRDSTVALAKELGVVGLMNVQFAVKQDDGRFDVYVLEVNPRASRTIPFVAKATGLPAGEGCGQGDGGRFARRARDHQGPGAVACFGEGGGVPVHQVHRRRHRARPRDALDRRSDGHQRSVFDGICQEPVGGRHRAAADGQHLHERGEPAQASGRRIEPHALGPRLLAPFDQRHGRHSSKRPEFLVAG